jgi:hypothetical protein
MDWIRELIRVQASTRFEVYPERVLVGEFKSPLKLGWSALNYFMDVYPTFYIILFSNHGVFHGSKTIKPRVNAKPSTIIPEVRNKAGKAIKRLGLKEVKSSFDRRMWEEYYDSQYIPARKNINAQKICFGSYKVPELRNYVRRKENKNLKDY